MSETPTGIDFGDDTLVRFYRVDSPDDLRGFTSDIDEFNDYIGPEMAFDLTNSITKVYCMEIAGYVAGYVDLAMIQQPMEAYWRTSNPDNEQIR